jgi:hypothetical protein
MQEWVFAVHDLILLETANNERGGGARDHEQEKRKMK